MRGAGRCGAVVALVSIFPSAQGHAFLAEPPSRNVVASRGPDREGKEYCPHCLQAGGPDTVKTRGGGAGSWPTLTSPQSHGLCGDPVQGVAVAANWRDETYLTPSLVQRTYTAGEVVEFSIGVSTHHRGHYEFRICDKALDGQTLTSREEGQECLNTWVLKRAPPRATCQSNDPDPDCQPLDEDHPERWYLPPPGANTQQAGSNWQDANAVPLPAATEVHRMRYQIPAELSCTHCTLQWYWSTGNTCLYDAGYFTHFQRMEALGWTSTDWCNFCTPGTTCQGTCCGEASGKFAEEFWNCADISVTTSGNTSPPVTNQPTSHPPNQPEPEPEEEGEEEAEEEAGSPAPSVCSALWGQCGGQDWAGPQCCEPGSYCQKQDPVWYHQCVPGAAPPPTPARTPPSTPPPTPAPTPAEIVAPMTCSHFCDKTNLTISGECASHSADKAACLESYIVKGRAAVPCAWNSCGCFADGEGVLDCPELLAECAGVGLRQKAAFRGSRHSNVSPHKATALIEASRRLARVEGTWDEEEEEEDMQENAEL